jgi:hypothetical protein
LDFSFNREGTWILINALQMNNVLLEFSVDENDVEHEEYSSLISQKNPSKSYLSQKTITIVIWCIISQPQKSAV